MTASVAPQKDGFWDALHRITPRRRVLLVATGAAVHFVGLIIFRAFT